MKSSSTALKWVWGLGARPAPETPLAASTTTPAGSMAPSLTRGAMADRGRRRVTPGRRHQGGPGQLVTKRLGMPNAASSRSSG